MNFGVRLSLELNSCNLGNLSQMFLIYNVEIKLLPHRVLQGLNETIPEKDLV